MYEKEHMTESASRSQPLLFLYSGELNSCLIEKFMLHPLHPDSHQGKQLIYIYRFGDIVRCS